MCEQCGPDRDRHADHAEAVAAAAAVRAREAPQCEDEADPRDQISEKHPGGRRRRLMHGPLPLNSSPERGGGPWSEAEWWWGPTVEAEGGWGAVGRPRAPARAAP